ncbi:MAG: dihydrodipicolinate synthase family protein [Lysobacterales bacterium]
MSKHAPKVMAASLTPLNSNFSIDHAQFGKHIHWLLDQGCDGVVLFGTTGEGNSFSVAERKAALQAVVDQGINPERLVVATGCCALPDTVELTRHALACGVHQMLVLPPFYYKTASDNGIFESFSQLIAQVDSEDLKILLYHFPKMAVVNFSPELIERLVSSFPAHITGIKDSTGDREHTQMLSDRFPSLAVYAGSEMFLADYLQAGGAGCISATANATAALAASVRDATSSAEQREIQHQLSAVRGAFEAFPLTGVLKGLLAHETEHKQWNIVRCPLSTLAPEKTQALANQLSELGFRLPAQ